MLFVALQSASFTSPSAVHHALPSMMGARQLVSYMYESTADPAASNTADLSEPIVAGSVTPASELYDPLSRMAEADVASNIESIHAEADAFFDAIDTDSNGSIDVEELRSHLASNGYSSSSVDAIFPLLDTDASGEVDRDELREAFVKFDTPSMRLALGLGTSEADAAFDRIDANGDGEIEQSEVASYLTAKGYPNPEETASAIFRSLDVNGDGAISRQELREGYVKYSSLREALGLGTANMLKNPKGVPKRFGRGRKKNAL